MVEKLRAIFIKPIDVRLILFDRYAYNGQHLRRHAQVPSRCEDPEAGQDFDMVWTLARTAGQTKPASNMGVSLAAGTTLGLWFSVCPAYGSTSGEPVSQYRAFSQEVRAIPDFGGSFDFKSGRGLL